MTSSIYISRKQNPDFKGFAFFQNGQSRVMKDRINFNLLLFHMISNNKQIEKFYEIHPKEC